MSRVSVTQQTLKWMATAVTIVAAAVLLWATACKCSLYHGHPEKHVHIITAKLIVEEERPVTSRFTDPLRAQTSLSGFPAVSPFLITLVRDHRAGMWSAVPSASGIGSCALPFCVSHFFSRPPPVLLS